MLRPLGAEEAAARPDSALPEHVDRQLAHSPAKDSHSALEAALRRSRDVIDMLQRVLGRR